jgi:hypothetical protein
MMTVMAGPAMRAVVRATASADVGEAGGGVAAEAAVGGRVRGGPRFRREHASVVGVGAPAT